MFGSLIACPVAANSYTLTGFICQATLLVLQVVPVLVSLALLFFFWGLATFILNSGDTDKLKEGRQRMVWGLVALFFILSISGVIAILMNTFFGGAGGAARPAPGGSSFSQQFNFQGSGAVNTPVQVTGSQGGSVQVQGGGEPGFFRRVWCAIGFGSCGSSSNTQSSSGGGGGSGGGFNDSQNQQLR